MKNSILSAVALIAFSSMSLASGVKFLPSDATGAQGLFNAAVETCSGSQIQQAIRQGLNLQLNLIVASNWGCLAGVRELLTAGANPNTVIPHVGDFYGLAGTPLIPDGGIDHNELAIVQALVEAGANVNGIGDSKPLASVQENETVRYLLNHGASVSGDDGRVALRSSVYVGYARSNERTLERLNLLIQAGAPVDNVEFVHSTSIMATRDTAVSTVDNRHHPGTLLSLAAEVGSPAILQRLIAAGADINAKTSTGYSAIDRAVQANRLDNFVFLANAGATFDYHGEDVYRITRAAIEGDDAIALSLALEHGASVARLYSVGEAVRHCAIHAVQALIAHGVDVNEANIYNGGTAIQDVIECYSRPPENGLHHPENAIPILRLLVAAHIDLSNTYTVGGGNGGTVLFTPVYESHVDVNRPWRQEHPVDYIPLISAFINAGVDINAPDNSGRTALQVAESAEYGNVRIAAFLRAHGATRTASRQRHLL